MNSIRKNRYHLVYLAIFVVGFPLSLVNSMNAFSSDNNGRIALTLVDEESQKIVPARIEVLDQSGKSYIANDAMLVGGDCGKIEEGIWSEHTHDQTLHGALAKFSKSLKAPFSEATHFYSKGVSTLSVPAGSVFIRVFKGPEYHIGKAEIQVKAGELSQKTIHLSRLANLPKNGWYSADDHLHIARTHQDVDPLVLEMMQAEDIHVGNMLQMGRAHSFAVTPQYAHGPDAVYQEGNYIIASGQENLRTHMLGHAITLGAQEKLWDRDTNLFYRKFWQQAVEQGAINGIAHFAANGDYRGYAVDAGLVLFLPYNLVHFIEVLQFNHARYGAWYDMLNLGFKVTPTAGSDYPCVEPNIPGKERFYTHVDGQLSYEKWLTSVKAGKTFVTNGPLLTFHINGEDIGSEIILNGPTDVSIEAELIYDPERDSVQALELVENGRLVYRLPNLDASGRMKFSIQRKIDETSWLALRTAPSISSSRLEYTTDAHTAPIYVNLSDGPSLAAHPRTKDIAKSFIAVLDVLELKMSDAHIQHFSDLYAEQSGQPVPAEVTINSRRGLMKELQAARKFYGSFPK